MIMMHPTSGPSSLLGLLIRLVEHRAEAVAVVGDLLEQLLSNCHHFLLIGCRPTVEDDDALFGG
jgi:hypothetical protein